jgi:hypothetical protein
MELQNFELAKDGISLNWQGYNLDLHNNFDFESLHYNLFKNQVALVWVKSPETWAKKTVLPGLTLLFTNVHFLVVKERDAAQPYAEDSGLMHVSFHPAALRNEFDSISLAPSPGDDLTFFFQSEWGIKINAEVAELIPLAEA